MQTEIDFGVPSSRNLDKRFYPHFDGKNWVCDCEHYTIHKTPCRHILIKQLEQEPIRYKNGVRDTSINAYLEMLADPDNLNERYREIMVALWEIGKPSTDREISRYLVRGDPNYVRPRRFELADRTGKYFYNPLIKNVEKRECDVSGKIAYVWDFTEEGRLITRGLVNDR